MEVGLKAIPAPSAPSATPAEAASFQDRVAPWMMACFGEEVAGDREERNHRFLEEALELVQAKGCTASEAHQLVDYVYGRPDGDVNQEVGGVMVTLAALCLANHLDMHHAGEIELARIWTKVEAIRAKQAAKPKHSPLPEVARRPAERADPAAERVRHVKRGTEYEVLSRGVELQIAYAPVFEGSRLVVYRGEDGRVWARDAMEFDDGRFAPAGQATPCTTAES